MSSKKLSRIGLPSNVVERLNVSNVLTCKDFLSKNYLELLKLLGLGYYSFQDVVMKCCSACAPKPVTALELLEQRKTRNFFCTSLPDLDRVLHGGLPVGTITEIAGPSGCGKTQFCIMLSVIAAANGGCVMYIDTESALSAERLIEVARKKYPAKFINEDQLVKVTKNVLVDVPQTCSALVKRLTSLEEEIISRGVRMIIVDSIASLVRKEYSGTWGRGIVDRTNFLAQQAAVLKYLAEFFQIPVVVTNQITTRFSHNLTPSDLEEGKVTNQITTRFSHNLTPSDLEEVAELDSGFVTAALGNTWSHNINTRLILQYIDNERRQVLVAKSPVAPFTSFTYRIKDEGVVQESDGACHYDGTDPGIQNIRVRSSLPLEYAVKSS